MGHATRGSLVFLAALTAAPAARAGGVVRFRSVLVIDASSSMRRTDPRGLRKVAAELFVDLARDGDEIAVVGFAGAATRGRFERVGPASRPRIKAAIRAIGADGAWTDFTAGLGEARRLLSARSGSTADLVVFLTDGRCEPDPGSAPRRPAAARARTRACLAAVLDRIVPALGGARVYAIGLSRGAPRAFLEELGRRTGGRGAVALRAGELPRLFADAYARLLGSRLQEGVARGAGAFRVLPGALTLDVVVVGRAARTGRLLDPAGRVVPIDNRDPAVAFTAARLYRHYKIARPAAGRWRLELPGRRRRRFAALQHFDLALALRGLPRHAELGQTLEVRAALASPKGTIPPPGFLDRHRLWLTVEHGGERRRVALRRAGDGWAGRLALAALGTATLGLALEPTAEGVLRMALPAAARVEVVPRIRLVGRAAPVSARQGDRARAAISLRGSAVGVPLTLAVVVEGGGEGVAVTPAEVRIPAGSGARVELSLAVDRDAPAGRREVRLALVPRDPPGLEARRLALSLPLTVVPLTFWERYGLGIMIGGAALLLLLFIVGWCAPARFPSHAVLYWEDRRDPDLPHVSSYAIGRKVRPRLFRSARQWLGPTGPVKRGGEVLIRAGRGGRIRAQPLRRDARVVRLPAQEDDLYFEDDGPQAVPPGEDGSFMMTKGVRYEVEGSGLVFWYR